VFPNCHTVCRFLCTYCCQCFLAISHVVYVLDAISSVPKLTSFIPSLLIKKFPERLGLCRCCMTRLIFEGYPIGMTSTVTSSSKLKNSFLLLAHPAGCLGKIVIKLMCEPGQFLSMCYKTTK